VLQILNACVTMTALGVKSVLTKLVLLSLLDIAHATKIAVGEKFVKTIFALLLLLVNAISIAEPAKIVYMENVSEHFDDGNDLTYLYFFIR
jgi:hypothetical protein